MPTISELQSQVDFFKKQLTYYLSVVEQVKTEKGNYDPKGRQRAINLGNAQQNVTTTSNELKKAREALYTAQEAERKSQSNRLEITTSTTQETIPQNIPNPIPESQTARITSASIINETIPVIKKPSVLPKVLLGGLILTLISA